MKKDVLIVIGPSACGKTTVVNLVSEMAPEFSFVRSMTTRPERFAGDSEYLYVDDETFAQAQKNGELLESMTYGEYSYGTPKAEIDRIAREGKQPLMILDLVGNENVRKSEIGGRVFSVYLYGDVNEIEQRLYDREMANADALTGFLTFQKRKDRNIADYLSMDGRAGQFDAMVENVTPDGAAEKILTLYREGKTADEGELAPIRAALHEAAVKKLGYTVSDNQ